jgi:hypothetical protein
VHTLPCRRKEWRITHEDFADVWLQQVVQPGRPGSFFERDAQISAQPVDELQDGARLGLDDAFHHHLAEGVPHGYRNTFRVHIHTDIFSAGHKRCSFLEKWVPVPKFPISGHYWPIMMPAQA